MTRAAVLHRTLGDLAGTDRAHRFESDRSFCARCFGWRDDPRHFLPAPEQAIDDERVARAVAALPRTYPRRRRPYRRAA